MSERESFPRQHARTRRFTLGRPRSFTVGRDRVLFLRSSAGDDPVHDLWSLDLATGSETRLVDARAISSGDDDLPAAERSRRERAREQAGGIVGYATDDELTLAAFALGGRLHTVDLASGEVRAESAHDAVVDPRPSPGGDRVAYVADGGIHVLTPGGPATTHAEGEGVTWGLADFIAAEELQRQRGFWWSPGGGELVAARVDDASVHSWWIADPGNPDAEPVRHRYPAAGTANPEVRLTVLSIAERRRIDLRWDHDALPYLVDVRWGTGGLAAILLDRPQRRMVVLGFDVTNGASEVLAEVTDRDWVDVVPGSWRWTDGGRLVSIVDVPDLGDGGTRTIAVDGRPVGPAGLQVRSLVDVDDVQATVVVSEHPAERHLARIGLDDGEVALLTSGRAVNAGTAGPGGLVVVTSPIDGPTRFEVRTRGTDVHPISSHAEEPVLTARPELLELGARGLTSALLLPEDADTRGPLPVLLDPYGGPHAQRVVASRDAHATSQWFADRGWAVLVVDGRGSPGRGPDFEREVNGDFTVALDDQLDALDDLLSRDDRLDADRVAIRGWSFGGWLAGLAAIRRPDRFRAAVIGAPVTDWHLYDTAYTERYLGHPDDAPEAYRRSSLVDADGALVDPAEIPEGRTAPGMLLIHGMADDNVVAAHTLRLSAALLAAGRPHEVLPLSGVTHMTPQEVVAERLLEHQLEFLQRHV